MTTNLKRGLAFASAFILTIQVMAWPQAVAAHRSPGTCNSNRLNVGITKDKTEVHQGDTLTYSVTRSNVDGSVSDIACDFTNVTIDVTLPSVDGTPTGTVVNIVTGVDYLAGTAVSTIATIPYVVNVNAGVSDVVAQVTASGTLHDAPIDHTASILKTIGTNVVELSTPGGSGSGTTSSSNLPGLPKTGVPSPLELLL